MEHEAGQVTVSDIEQRLSTTREEIDATERALAALPQKKQALLGAETFDDTALAKLETTEATLSRKREYLAKRIPLLEKQLEEVEAQHAQERIAELVTETATVRAEYEEHLAQFRQETERVRESAEKLVERYRTMQTLWDEQDYLVERYQENSVQPGALTDTGEMPDHERLARDIFESIRMLKLQWSVASRSEWGRKTSVILEERSRRANPNPSGFVPGHVRVAG